MSISNSIKSYFQNRKIQKEKLALEKNRSPIVAVGRTQLVKSGLFDKDGLTCELHTFFYEKNGKRWAEYEFSLTYLKDRAIAMVKGEVRIWIEGGSLPSWAEPMIVKPKAA